MKWIGLLGISFLAFTAFLDFTIVNTALPFIKEYFQSNILELQWVTNIFSMVLTMTMVAVGRFADIFGRVKVFYIGVIFFALAAWGAGFSPNIEILIIFRALQALGASVLFVSSASLITDLFPPSEHGKSIGIYSGITGLGLAIGPFLGGILVEWLDWRWVFWINVPLLLVGFALCLKGLKVKQKKIDLSIDWKGLVLLIVGLGSFIYGIISLADRYTHNAVAWTTLLAGIALLVLFARVEWNSKDPLLDFSIFKNDYLKLAVLSCSIAGMVSFVFMFFDPLYLNLVRNLDAFKIGLLIAAIPVAQVIISFLFNPLLKQFGIRKLIFASIILAFFAVISHLIMGQNTPLLLILIPFAFLGLNWGISNAGTIVCVNKAIPPERISSAIGSVFMVWNMGGSIFLALSSALFHVKQDESFLSGFHAVVWLNGIIALIVVILTMRVLSKAKR